MRISFASPVPALVCSLLLLAACATTGSISNAPLALGTARAFPGDYDAVLKASRESVVETGLAIENATQVNDSTYMIVGKKGVSLLSWGELVRVVVQKTGPTTTAVRVHTERRVATDVAANADYSGAILSNIELKLR